MSRHLSRIVGKRVAAREGPKRKASSGGDMSGWFRPRDREIGVFIPAGRTHQAKNGTIERRVRKNTKKTARGKGLPSNGAAGEVEERRMNSGDETDRKKGPEKIL